MAKLKRPKDTNQLAKSIVDIATGEIEETKSTEQDLIKAAAAALGRKGGLKGGKARAASLTPKRRSEIAKKAAAARWDKK
ncbi:hypothetical protein LK994_11515 [Ferruginibacter lapsinanis]|uniref:hypothetical protein n=1 Tax=Ferruginibacter lapsinanis TaxID=563172 RepID=UPI001E4C1337|nr:hypothetical protein [Ferruginibacter lapsinanis]UEG49259.1 hypothetical protein LK994_11515 [Ferruginibacter lapsinanis]